MTTGRALDTFVALPPNFGTEYPCQHIGVSFIGDILYKTRVRCSWILVWGVFFPSSGVTTRTYLTRVATFPFTKLGRFAFNVDFGLFSLSPVDIVFLKMTKHPHLRCFCAHFCLPKAKRAGRRKTSHSGAEISSSSKQEVANPFWLQLPWCRGAARQDLSANSDATTRWQQREVEKWRRSLCETSRLAFKSFYVAKTQTWILINTFLFIFVDI